MGNSKEGGPPPDEEILDKGKESYLEEELSPETLERVMEKVRDIDSEGTAFSSLSQPIREKLGDEDWSQEMQPLVESIYLNGLLGSPIRLKSIEKKRKADFTEWRDTIRAQGKTKKTAPVFFNIVGRMRDAEKIKDIQGVGGYILGDTLTIIFDLSQYEEIAPPIENSEIDEFASSYNRPTTNPYTFWVDPKGMDEYGGILEHYSPEEVKDMMRPGSPNSKKLIEYKSSLGHGKRKWVDESGRLCPNSEYGFVLSYRVPPRFFRGLVLNVTEKETRDDEIARMGLDTVLRREARGEGPSNLHKPITDMDVKIKRAGYIAREMRKATEDNHDLLVPIYDMDGNLLWPKQMTHKEVKELVDSRENK